MLWYSKFHENNLCSHWGSEESAHSLLYMLIIKIQNIPKKLLKKDLYNHCLIDKSFTSLWSNLAT